jgi:hypothetical protein
LSAQRRVVVRRRAALRGSRRTAALAGPAGSGDYGLTGSAMYGVAGHDVPGVPAIVGLQLRQALRTVGAVAALLVGAPVLAAWLPEPGAWVAMSVAVHLAWVGLAVRQLRRAERLER